MTRKLLSLIAAIVLAFSALPGIAAETNSPASDLQNLISRIQTKLREGKKTEAALAPELKEFDALLAKYKGDKSDEVASILWMKVALYKEVFEDEAKAKELTVQLRADFPDSKA